METIVDWKKRYEESMKRLNEIMFDHDVKKCQNLMNEKEQKIIEEIEEIYRTSCDQLSGTAMAMLYNELDMIENEITTTKYKIAKFARDNDIADGRFVCKLISHPEKLKQLYRKVTKYYNELSAKGVELSAREAEIGCSITIIINNSIGAYKYHQHRTHGKMIAISSYDYIISYLEVYIKCLNALDNDITKLDSIKWYDYNQYRLQRNAIINDRK